MGWGRGGLYGQTGAGELPAAQCQGSECRRHKHNGGLGRENQNKAKISISGCGSFKGSVVREIQQGPGFWKEHDGALGLSKLLKVLKQNKMNCIL